MKRQIPYPVNALVSYHYFADYDLDRLPNLRLIGDSGAFSAKSQGAEITPAALAEWGRKWSHRLSWLAALDVIGDPGATYRNWWEMVERHHVHADHGRPQPATRHPCDGIDTTRAPPPAQWKVTS